jgi:CheY-like chemotaxis protein
MGKKILLADDSITIQKVIELTFSDEDFEVTTVGNGRLAIERIQEVRPDVILCDIIMPEKDGYEVCDFVKSNPALAGTPVLLLAGAFEPFDQERAARVKSDGFLAKPFEPQTLIARVKELMSRAAPPASVAAPPRDIPESVPVMPSPVPPPPPSPPAAAPAPEAAGDSEEYNFIPEEPFAAAAKPSAAEDETVPAAALEEEFYSVVEAPQEPTRGAPELEMVTEYEEAEAPFAAEAPRETVQEIKVPQAAPTPPPISEELELTPEPASREATPNWKEPTEEMTWEARAQASAQAESSVESASALFEEVFDEDLTPADAVVTTSETATTETVQPTPPPARPPEVETPPSESFVDVMPPEKLTPPPESTAAQVPVPTEMVSQIAQRVIGQVSEKIVREIAWEVVPEMAETMIKKEIERLKSELKET